MVSKRDEEWANAWTHGLAAVMALLGGGAIIWHTWDKPLGMTISCLAFVASAFAVFAASTLSHVYLDDEAMLTRLRAWDQGLIYFMIVGTYTPIIYRFADSQTRLPLLLSIWFAASAGFYSKVFVRHRVNGIGTVTYLALGWVPAFFLVGRVPGIVLTWMTVGGVLYTLGVVVLLNDSRAKYLHSLWHLFVIAAASCHFWAIYQHVTA